MHSKIQTTPAKLTHNDIMKKILLSLLLTLAQTTFAFGKDAAYIDVGKQAKSAAINAYQKYGVCNSPQECHKKKIIFFIGQQNGIEVFIYSTNKEDLLIEIINIYAKLFTSSNMKNLSIFAFKEDHATALTVKSTPIKISFNR